MRGLFWGSGGKAPSRQRHGDLGAKPPALENFAFSRKNNLILGTILTKNSAFKTWHKNWQRNMIQLVALLAMWEVANDNIAVHLFTCW